VGARPQRGGAEKKRGKKEKVRKEGNKGGVPPRVSLSKINAVKRYRSRNKVVRGDSLKAKRQKDTNLDSTLGGSRKKKKVQKNITALKFATKGELEAYGKGSGEGEGEGEKATDYPPILSWGVAGKTVGEKKKTAGKKLEKKNEGKGRGEGKNQSRVSLPMR